jgi:hypothetical protein
MNAQNNISFKVKHTTDFNITGDGTEQEWNSASWNTITQRSNEELQKANWYITSEELQKSKLNIKRNSKFYILIKAFIAYTNAKTVLLAAH